MTTNDRRVLVHPDVDTLVGSVAARFLTKIADVLDERAAAHVCLTGGTLGSAVLAAINTSAARDSVDWSRIIFWWGDERYLPHGDPDRNDTQSRAALLDDLSITVDNLRPFPAPGDQSDIGAAAAAFSDVLASEGVDGETAPRFDVTFLGVGPDGHVASLFPDHEAVLESERTVIAETASPKPPPERLSLGLPVLNASDRIWLVLAGQDKAGALGLALAGASVSSVPVAGVLGRKRTVFFVDQEAAGEVPESLIAREQFWTSTDEGPPKFG
jgi:6-phosphogluconolactonase